MKGYGLSVYKIAVSIFVIIFLSSLAINTITAATKDYWCKYKDDMYELKYDKVSDIQDKIDDNPGSYWGMCDIYNDLGEYLTGDQNTDGDYAQENEEIAFCHYDESDGTWHQVYEDYTGYLKAFWCEDQGDGTWKTKLEKKSKIEAKVTADILDGLSSDYGPCDAADDPKSMVWCEYKGNKWSTKNDTPSNVETKLDQNPGSHRGGCTYHEWHTNDYWGHCSDTSIADSTIAPEPPPESLKEKREGPGVGNGHTTGKRSPKPRILSKSLNRDRSK